MKKEVWGDEEEKRGMREKIALYYLGYTGKMPGEFLIRKAHTTWMLNGQERREEQSGRLHVVQKEYSGVQLEYNKPKHVIFVPPSPSDLEMELQRTVLGRRRVPCVHSCHLE